MSKVLLTHRFFAPDTSPYGLILKQIALELVSAGFEVSVFTSSPSYGDGSSIVPKLECINGVNIFRTWVLHESKKVIFIRLANVVLYCFPLFFHILKTKPDVVFAGTFPPVIAAWFASFAAKIIGAKFIYHVQDIHPEISIFSGSLSHQNILSRVLFALDNQSLQRADKIVTLSEDMSLTLKDRNHENLPLVIINNPPLEVKYDLLSIPPELIKPSGVVRVVFAGNIGRFQNLSLLAEGISQCFRSHPELELLFLGDGVMVDQLKSRWSSNPQVLFWPYLPFSIACNVIRNCDVGLVSLAPNMYRVAYPSKVSTYLALGLRLLALVERDSQLAKDLEVNGHGVVPKSFSIDSISQALDRLLSESSNINLPNNVDLKWPALVNSALNFPKENL